MKPLCSVCAFRIWKISSCLRIPVAPPTDRSFAICVSFWMLMSFRSVMRRPSRRDACGCCDCAAGVGGCVCGEGCVCEDGCGGDNRCGGDVCEGCDGVAGCGCSSAGGSGGGGGRRGGGGGTPPGP